MPETGLDVPVVFIMFNRPRHARTVLDAIALARPRQLFVIADGPRPGRPDDIVKCAETRALLERVDWPCDVRTDFSAVNLGCGGRISSGLDHVFEQVERAIVLEDDCVPDPTFFRFCEELLERHADDERVRTISGSNFLMGKVRNRWSYHFSNFHALHGYATWRRSWQKFDRSMRLWPEIRDNGWLVDVFGSRRTAALWTARFDLVHRGDIDSYAYPYLFSCFIDHALSVTPNVNLVRNTGFGADSTNTNFTADFTSQGSQPMRFPLVHPPFVVRDTLADAETVEKRLVPEEGPWLKRTLRPFYRLLTGRDSRRVKLHRARWLERSAQP